MSARRLLLWTLVVLWSPAAWAEIPGFTISKIEGLNGVELDDDRFATTPSATNWPAHKVNYRDCLAYLGISEGQSLAEPDAEGAEVVEADVVETVEVTDAASTDVPADTVTETATDAGTDGAGGGGGDTAEGIRKISIEWSVANPSLAGRKWWYSIRTGTGCSESAEVDAEATETCTYLRQKTELVGYELYTLEIPVTRLLGTECTKGSTGDARVYFTVQAESNFNERDTDTVTVDYDYDPPKAVQTPTLEAGETNLQASWTDESNTEDVTYTVYWSPDTFDDDTLSNVESKGDLTAKDYQITGLENGTRYWVAVAALDDFDNPSTLTDRVDGTPVEVTDGFEFYKNAGGTDKGGFGCAMGDTGAASAAVLLLVALALLATFAGARRPATRRGA